MKINKKTVAAVLNKINLNARFFRPAALAEMGSAGHARARSRAVEWQYKHIEEVFDCFVYVPDLGLLPSYKSAPAPLIRKLCSIGPYIVGFPSGVIGRAIDECPVCSLSTLIHNEARCTNTWLDWLAT